MAAWVRVLFLAWLAVSRLPALTAELVVAQDEVFQGEPFLMEIVVDGDDSPEEPSMAPLDGFSVQERGGQAQNSSSFTMTNGRIDRQVRRGYIFRYVLTAQRTGRLIIPAFTVRANGESATTRPKSIAVRKPEESDEFKLRVSLSKSSVYVGEPVTVRAKWYIGQSVQDFTFSMPLMEDDRFVVIDDDPRVDPAHKDEFVTVGLGTRSAIARKEQDTLDGRTYLTVSFSKVLIPKEPGSLELPQTLVSLETSGPVRNRSVWDDFFSGADVFGRGRRTTRRFVVPANDVGIVVKPLPEAGKPPRFTGLVGDFSLSAAASPRAVSVGEPVTLTVRVQGPRYLGNVLLPPLSDQPAIVRDFKVPADRATGVVEGGAKVFTQTLRAMHSGVVEVPPIELPYFDPASGKYAVARSEAIPLEVTGTTIVTARDAEGSARGAIETAPIETVEDGISYNYEDAGALVDEGAVGDSAGGPVMAVVLGGPPLAFGLLWAGMAMRRRLSDAPRRRGPGAARAFDKAVSGLSATGDGPARLLAALQDYLGETFGLPPRALTFGDVADRLRDRGLDDEALAEWRRLFNECEAARFGAGSSGETDLIERARKAVDTLERTAP